jgi:hypothetical protein
LALFNVVCSSGFWLQEEEEEYLSIYLSISLSVVVVAAGERKIRWLSFSRYLRESS